MKKIEIFNKGAALILGKLYEEFPTPIMLDLIKLDTDITEDEAGIYSNTVSFLREEVL